MKKGIGTAFRFPLFCVACLIVMIWVVDVSLAAGPYTMVSEVNNPVGGSAVANPTSVPEGGSVTFTANANAGYYIEKVTMTDFGTVFTQALPLTYGFPTDNRPHNQYAFTINGVFKSYLMSVDFRRYYDLFSAVTTTGGTISPDGLIPVPRGSSKSYTIAPFEGFHIDNVT